MKLKKYLLEFVVFTTGAVVMILELCGSRILAPYVGVSIVVWTSLIGIILGCLSIGYMVGGRIADKRGSREVLAFVIFLGALSVAAVLLVRLPVLTVIDALGIDLASKAVVGTIVLFAVPSILLGMVSPLAVKLKLQSLKTAGGTVGSLYAVSTIGSIAGTFLAGFVLLAFFSVTHILIGLSLALFLLSLLLSGENLLKRAGMVGVLLVGIVFLELMSPPLNKTYESRYNHIEIERNGNVKVLRLDNKWHSAMFVDSNELVFDYTKYYHLARMINPDAKRILMIGGGAYSVPKEFLRVYPDIEIDVVELDPFLTELAFQEFGLKKDPRLMIYHEDGRTFLNREAKLGEKMYDAIFMDVFSSFSIPFHLTTLEVMGFMDSLLADEGVVVTNIISSIEGERGRFLQAEVATYKEVFPFVHVYPVNTLNSTESQNLILVAAKEALSFHSEDQWNLNDRWEGEIPKMPILTDDFAPVDQYVRVNER